MRRESLPTTEKAVDALESGRRPLRADARRNRDRLLATAVKAFSSDGPDASLDAIAKAAGVGIGTLYRHFPTREALIEATYRNEVARLCDVVPQLLAELPPRDAIRAWIDGFIAYATTKRGMADALRALVASGGNPFVETRGRLVAALTALMEAGAGSGAVRADVDPADVLATLSGISLVAGEPEQADQAGRLIDLLMDGLRPVR